MKSTRIRKCGGGSNLPAPGERLLTVAELAAMWRISPRTVRRMIADGRIKVVRLGRAVRIPA